MNQEANNAPQQPEPITHLIVDANAYQAVLNTLAELPYKQAAPVLQQLQAGTRPAPPQGQIVDDGGEGGAES